ncbi:hypothetical protein BH09BAC3_BH09BAC3_32040 [soil metagenome]
MKIIEILEKGHSKAITSKIVKHVGHNPVLFRELVGVFLAGPYRITQRAAWPLSICVVNHPKLVKPYLKAIIKYLDHPGIHDAVKRNTVRFLQFIDIPKSLQGRVVDICFGFLSNPREPIAVRVFSMTVLANLAKQHPELKDELKIYIEDHLPFGGPAFRSRGYKILKLISKP